MDPSDRMPRALGVVATVAAVLALVLGIARLVPHHDATRTGSRLPLPTALPTVTLPTLPSLPTSVPSLPPLRPTHAPAGGAAVPAEIIAFTPGGAERPTVVRTSTGKILRVLGPGTQWIPEQGSDHKHLYLPYDVTSPCGEGWKVVTVATGARHPVPGLLGLTGFAESPAGGQIATIIGRDGCGNSGNEVGTVLQVRDIATGDVVRQAQLPDGNWDVKAWSPDGGELLLADLMTNTTWTVYDAARLTPLRTLPDLPSSCEGGDATLRGDGDVVRAETCTDGGHTHVDLVDVAADGEETQRVRVVTSPEGYWGPVYNGLGLDASRQNIVLTLQPTDDPDHDGQLWYVAGTRPHRVGLNGVFGAFW